MDREINCNRIGSSDVALQVNGLSTDCAINVYKVIGYSLEKNKTKLNAELDLTFSD